MILTSALFPPHCRSRPSWRVDSSWSVIAPIGAYTDWLSDWLDGFSGWDRLKWRHVTWRHPASVHVHTRPTDGLARRSPRRRSEQPSVDSLSNQQKYAAKSRDLCHLHPRPRKHPVLTLNHVKTCNIRTSSDAGPKSGKWGGAERLAVKEKDDRNLRYVRETHKH